MNLPLQHFILRVQARSLYRKALRLARCAPSDTVASLRAHARAEFEARSHVPLGDIEQRKFWLAYGTTQLEKYKTLLYMSR